MYDILYIIKLLFDIIYELLMRCHPPPAFPKSERFDPGTVTPYISYIIIYYNALEKLETYRVKNTMFGKLLYFELSPP